MKGQGGGGTARGGGKNRSGGGSVAVTKTKARKTKDINDNIVKLRKAVYDETGKDKDVTKSISPLFMKFDRNGLNVKIEFAAKLNKLEAEWAFEVVKDSMEDRYDAAGYGWDDEDKHHELTESGTRFLLVRESSNDDSKGDLVAFVHFRFTVQGEVLDMMAGEPCLYIFDIHVEEKFQKKGLGKHLLTVLELIARKESMTCICLPVVLHDEETKAWLAKTGRGFAVDHGVALLGFDPAQEGFDVYSKHFTPPAPRPAAAVDAAVSAPAPVSVFTAAMDKAANEPAAAAEKIAVEIEEGPVGATDGEEESAAMTPEEQERIVADLKAMFLEKHSREPTEAEIDQWKESLKTLPAADAVDGDEVVGDETEVEDGWVHL